jgi:hypothetical protein
VEAVAAGDEVAFDLVVGAVLLVAHRRLAAVEVVQAHVRCLVDRGRPCARAGFHQVARQFGLAVGGDHLAAGEAVHVDGVPRPEHQLDAVVDDAFAVTRSADAGFAQQVHGDLLQDAGADAAQHVVAALALDDDVVDAGLVQQLAEQQAGGAGADDRDLGAHGGCLLSPSLGALRPPARGSGRRGGLCDHCAPARSSRNAPEPR